MKKYIITIIVMVGLLSVPSVYAGLIKPLFIDMTKEKDVFVGSKTLQEQGLSIVKFLDGNVVCYTSITKINGIVANTSISCIK